MARHKAVQTDDTTEQENTLDPAVARIFCALANGQPIAWTNQVHGPLGSTVQYGLVGDGSVAIKATRLRDTDTVTAKGVELVRGVDEWRKEDNLQIFLAKLPDGTPLAEKILELARLAGQYTESAKTARAK